MERKQEEEKEIKILQETTNKAKKQADKETTPAAAAEVKEVKKD